MKTILYQPLFINPQAYFVFPQLYHIEKGDSYIEPANITGQLIINDLTQSLTSTPILNVVQDTNQVDFGLFKGKHIRISQYTNIGAVALGEWYIPGTPTPPEPEQPDWFKESIVAWYSPYCKQRMTNFDVIESYVTDFTTWRTADKNYVGLTIRSSSFSISFNKVSNHVIMWKPNYLFNEEGQVKLQVSGITNNISIIIKHGTQEFPIVNGVNTFSFTQEENKSLSFVCKNVFQDTNITITQLPTSILKDFSGNGNHAYLYGGKGKLDSGMGVYKFDFLSDLRINSAYIPYTERQYDSICSLAGHPNGWLFQYKSLTDIPTFKVEVKGIVNDRFVYRYYDENGNRGKEIIINKDGIYELPISYSVENNTGVGIVCSDACVDNVCFTQIPDYPDQLCYDGKMYAVAYDMPILTDYTIITDRTWFKDKINTWSYFADKKKAFVFERTSNGKSFNANSFAAETAIELQKDGVSYQTKASYNGNAINYHSDQADNDDRLVIGSTKDSLGNQCFIGCHSDILIFNRTLTEYEISWVKNNMMCSKQQEPDIDL